MRFLTWLLLLCLTASQATSQAIDIEGTLRYPPPPVALTRIIDSTVGLETPMDLVFRPGDSRMYVVELTGRVRIWDGSALATTPFLDMRSMVEVTAGTGLRGMAFHPEYATNGFVFVWYDFLDTSGQIHIGLGRWTRSTTLPDEVDPTSFVELLREPQQGYSHASSRVVFGPDGMLYVALGDGGVQEDPLCNGQNHQWLMGSMLRLDVDAAFPYSIPQDNPFLNDPSVRDESWHVGMRHPWRWSFDRATGDLWIGDVGQYRYEEIDYVPAGQGGRNFGWSVVEGPECFANTACVSPTLPCPNASYTDPIYAYDHSVGCAIIGGFVYRGQQLPSFYGRYFFADLCSNQVWSLAFDGQQVSDVIDHTTQLFSLNGGSLQTPSMFAETEGGELLVVDYGGNEVFQFVSTCSAVRYCEGGTNSLGLEATLTSTGSSSVQANALVLHVGNAPAATIGQVFYGPLQTYFPQGGGILCVGAATAHAPLPSFVTDNQGTAQIALDLTLPPLNAGAGHILAGSHWNFQAWYRDPGASGLEISNFSEAVAIFFCN